MTSEGHGQMLIVDASCLFEVLARAAAAPLVRVALEGDADHAAPHLIDGEVMMIIRRDWMLGRLDNTAADRAVDELRDWPGKRFGHVGLLRRCWELRQNVRAADAMYVALAEALGGTLLTMDGRLGRSTGLRCPIRLVAQA